MKISSKHFWEGTKPTCPKCGGNLYAPNPARASRIRVICEACGFSDDAELEEEHVGEAFVEINDPFVCVALKRSDKGEVESDAYKLACVEPIGQDMTSWTSGAIRPRISTDGFWFCAYIEFHPSDSNVLADLIKAKLVDLGYKLTERFEV